MKIDIDKLTPMMQQYMKIKEKNMDSIVFYRLGDFYEMFFDDAKLAAKELELTLTGRDCGLEERAPMAGVPHHVAEVYINRLVDRGYKVAVVDQVEDPKKAKGIVKRSVVRIVTPGTIIDLEGKQKENNFLLSIFWDKKSFGLAYIDITTGEFNTTEIVNSPSYERDLIDFIVKVDPREIILNKELKLDSFQSYIKQKNIFISIFEPEDKDIKSRYKFLDQYIKSRSLKKIDDRYFSILSASMLMEYIYLFQDFKLKHIDSINYIEYKNYMRIDANTRQNLEIHKNLYDGSRKNTLLEVIDRASTPMGSRKLNSWLEFPLIDIGEINYRQNLVEYFYKDRKTNLEMKKYLSRIYDLERLLSKISYGRANAKDLVNLKNSIYNIGPIKELLKNSKDKSLHKLNEGLDSLEDLASLLEKSIREDAPVLITEGDLIKEGFNEELDKLKYQSMKGKKMLVEYQEEQREKTGIKTLKVSYNKNTGYYIELTRSNIKYAPDYYIRRQTLKNSERYMTDKLNEISDMILGSESDTVELEYDLFTKIRDEIGDNASRIKSATEIVSFLDAIISLADLARDNNYRRPSFNRDDIIQIKDSRHPVVELSMDQNEFIANDVNIGQKDNRIQIITGPNMAGKSTYMRQVALIILLAQIGSFIPASSASLCISDALFTRIGASDNLAKGDSTFMVEMKEMSNIIHNASERSFIILDEVGRGTSTNDGLSIAFAIVEYLSKKIKAKTFFATHYHELTQSADEFDNVRNLKVDIAEDNGELIFLRKILEGSADKSYGIEVAKLSGLPSSIIDRANQILEDIDQGEKHHVDFKQLEKEDPRKDFLINDIRQLDIDNMTAKNAYDYLYDLIERVKDL